MSLVMVGAANSDSARISFFGSTKGELAQKLDRGQDAVGRRRSSAPRTARNGRLLHGSLTLPGMWGTYYSSAVRRTPTHLNLKDAA